MKIELDNDVLFLAIKGDYDFDNVEKIITKDAYIRNGKLIVDFSIVEKSTEQKETKQMPVSNIKELLQEKRLKLTRIEKE